MENKEIDLREEKFCQECFREERNCICEGNNLLKQKHKEIDILEKEIGEKRQLLRELKAERRSKRWYFRIFRGKAKLL